MKSNLKSLKYDYMTPIQEKCIPEIIKGGDILAQAKTGSGKTAAFGIGTLEQLNIKSFRIQSVIVCPTRELAEQVTTEIRRLARFKHNIKVIKLIGGFPMYKQEQSLRHKAHIAVGTPGRILKLLQRGSLDLGNLKNIVLDEADRMLDMGFIDQIDEIIKYTPESAQILCFSATFSKDIKKLSREILVNPREVVVESTHDTKVIKQHIFKSSEEDKTDKLIKLLKYHNPESVIVFCNTKDACRRVNEALLDNGIYSVALHGDLEQKERTETLIMFSNGSSRIMVATDVAARGLDIDGLGAVVNFDLPFETETYIHRIGRSGRAGNEGLSLSFLIPGEEFRLDEINKYQDSNLEYEDFYPIEESLKDTQEEFHNSQTVTISINGGRRTKVSPGDILGAITSNSSINGSDVGKIDRLDYITFIAIKDEVVNGAVETLENKGVKGKVYKVVKHIPKL